MPASVVPIPAEPLPAEVLPDDFLRLDQQLCFALYSASLAMTKVYRPLLDALGLTYPQYLVMLVLWERGSASVGELGERLNLDSGTLTPLLKRLEQQGRLARERNAVDERRVDVRLTEEGLALREQARQIPPRILEGVGCTVDELGSLTRRLQALRDTLQDR
ncbi:MarR family winged helix-turn-helix transcriptional regulator [Leptothrix discophora]|uniref:MarR family transcriptional regulator n=1 Tax=Leptothrix discophora TaxID=89 RepID=A0ABT9G191_LEPDI|nr:MarR family transcriptional regulator [Leptothrix discophora]MDP4300247.1 MarR family transcriptional regulator [Leptothrix discophora]